VRALTLRAATALGVGTEATSAITFGWRQQVKPALAKLSPTESWNAWRSTAGQPRRIWRAANRAATGRGTALLCPFDPLIFSGQGWAALSVFTTASRSTPSAETPIRLLRWPFMLDGRLVGRVDLKAERTRDALHVVGAFTEPGEKRRWSPMPWHATARDGLVARPVGGHCR